MAERSSPCLARWNAPFKYGVRSLFVNFGGRDAIRTPGPPRTLDYSCRSSISKSNDKSRRQATGLKSSSFRRP